MMEEAENRVIQARDVYVLMKKDYRISRNIRALWFFQHLNKTLQFIPQEHLVDTTEELQVGSVVADDGTQCFPGQKYSVALLPSTMVTFMARRYRFVIILDVSPSVSSVDTSNCSVLYEKVHTTLSNFLRGIVLPFQIPGSTAVLSPEIHITVIAYTPVKSFTFNQVLAQGLVITADNVEKILSSMAVKLRTFESTLADNFKKCLENTSSNFANSYYDVHQAHADPIGPQLSKDQDIINNPEAGIVNMLRSGMMALQLLPENSSSGLVVITDGCLGVPDANLFEFLLTQLRTSTIACTFLRVGETRTPFGQFGHVAHTELMQFISTATFGSYFDTCPDVTGSESRLPNVYHKAMFLWSFQRGLEGFRFDLGDQHLMAQQSSSPAQLVQRLLSHPIHGNLASVMPNLRKRHSESKLNASLFSVLSVRLREGYTIRDIAITKGETQLDVRLVLPWREYARFEYLVRAAWPLDKNRPLTHTEITIEGSYDFLHDMTCTKINTNKMSGFRSANVKKFWQVLQGLSQTDQLLVHLQSFSTKLEHYTLPGSIKEGVPLFYLPLPNSVTPTLSTQLNSKDTVLNQFASFWRPVVNLDIKVWQKWMHTHRIGLVLEHDIGVTKHIHIPSSSFRYTMVMCRLALTSLNLFLSSWSTFVLLDSQSYIKLVYENAEDKTKQKPPSSFVLVRITSKAPCLVLRLAFLGGTPGYQRYELVKELKQKVAELKFPKRFIKSDKERRSALRKFEEKDIVHKPPLTREWSEIKCCVLLVKPVESILIRYEKVPPDMTKLEEQATPEVSQFLPYSSQPKNKSAANQLNSLSRYLLHQRWIWTLQQAGVNSISMSGIGRILSTLTKMRIQQGFHFGYTNQGIVNMVVELDMKDTESGIDYTVKSKQKPTCVVQYILFPPYTKTSSDSLSDDDEEMESTEDDGILQIIMECWVEPQHGVAVNNTAERKQFEGITCEQIPTVLFPQDLTCISSLLTFEHLSYLCQNSLIPADLASIVNTSTHPASNVTQLSPTIKHIDFPFELLSLLPRSQQAELIYPTYTYGKGTEDEECGKEANGLLYKLLLEELSSSYHREVNLSQGQSALFLQHVHSRPRSTETYPFPFEIEKFTSLADETKPENKSSQSQSQSIPKLSVSQSQASFQSLGSCAQGRKDSESVLRSDCIKVPEWKCFIKGGDSSSITLTFVPASFQDVIHLNEPKENSGPETTENNAQTESACVSTSLKDRDDKSNKLSPDAKSEQMCNKTGDSTHLNSENVESSAIGSGVSVDGDEADAANSYPEEIINSNTEEISSKKPLVVPVYIYDCLVHNILQSLINPWDFQLAADIYQDMTFDSSCEQSEPFGLGSPRSLKRVSFSADSFKDEEEPPWRSSWRSQERRSTEGSTDGGENLWQQCSSLSEMFYNCFVKGVFQSLQKTFSLDSQDIDAAINNICEEALPLESNMTTFLHASCCHFQHLVNEARKDQERLSDQNSTGIEDMKAPSVRFMDILDDTDGEMQSKIAKIPSVLELPKVTLTFDLSLLHLDLPCEPLKDLHQLIKDKFLDIVQKWFRQVPSSPDYYFYCPDTAQSEGELSDERETTASDAAHGASAGTMPESDGNMGMDTLGLAVKSDRISCTSVLDSEESMEDDVILDLDITRDDRSDQSPLFINFTCTVKSRLQQYSLSLRNIAVCIGELSTTLEKFSEVELSDLKITFDLNCLTLPGDLEIASPRKPSMLRMLSYSSANIGSSSGSDLEERGSNVSTVDMKHLKDPINHLPQRQHDAVTKCMEEIEWLLQDEIVSNLRHISPINTDALNFVAKHIQSSSGLGKANVSVDNVPLQFVFGSDQSNEKFTEQFQKMSFQNYQLNKEDEWYYLSKKRILAFNYVNASMLSSALVELSQWGGKQGSNAKAGSPSSVSEQTDNKSTKNLSPLIGGAKDKSFDIGTDHVGCSSPVTVKTDGTSPSEVKRHSRESSLSIEKRTSSEGLSLENVSLINRRRSKELKLKMMKGNKDNLSDKEKRRSSGEHAAIDQGKADSPIAESKTAPKQEKDAQDQTDISKDVDEAPKKPDDMLQKERESVVSPITAAITSLVDLPSTESATFSVSGTGSHVTSAVQSPVVSDVSIQLTKTDGRCEPFRTSPERVCTTPSMVDDSYDSTDLENEAVLKRCSSFAGFISQEPCVPTKQDSETEFQGPTPLKPYHHSLIGPQGRSRHCSAPVSGQGTPRSKVSVLPYTPSCISSRGSFTEDGASYDGDMSEMDDSATTFSESGVVTRLMPNFWLIMQINFNGVDINNIEMSTVDILFQHRETGKETNEETLELRNLLSQVKSNVETTCRRVNQQLLLNDLYESRMCHNLLVDAAEEEVSWKLDGDRRIKPRHALHVSSSENDDDDDDDDTFERKYLAAAMNLDPGYFDCTCVWQTKLYIHPGLKRGAGRGSTMSIGIKALRSVLNPLSVNNRNNMFVIKETTTENVFYLRLKEIQSSSSRSAMVTEDSTDTLSMSGGLKLPEQDADTVSISSSNSTLSLSQSQKVVPQDCVELTVHGIDDASKEIKEDLIQMLQKKLDEATLDKISEMLRRNPQCQLDSHDVQFIQKPGLEPAKTLHLTVSNRASPQLAAVMYYLRQNLLQFLHPPKYKSSLAEHQFMDTFDGKLTSIPADQAFLYIPPHTARKTGISVVSVCLVDGQGNQVRLLQCPKPSSLAYLDIETKQDLESFVIAQTFEIQPNSKKPGPTALIQFHIWQVGDVDIPVLQEKLTLALKYALCDVVMEYHILTAPLCTVPKHLVDMLPPPPTYSAPTSPFHSMPGEEFRERKLSMVLKKPSDSNRGVDRRASLQNPSRFQALRDAFIHSSKRVMSPTPDSNKVFDLPGFDSGPGSKASSPMPDRALIGSPHRPDPGNIVNQYESGDRGTLHKMYSDLMEGWFKYCSQQEIPSVNKLNLSLKSRFSIDYVLQEFQHMVSRLSQTMSTKVYKMLPKEEVDEDSNIGVLYVPNRSPFEAGRRRSETSLDNCRPVMLTPGIDSSFTAVSRDLEQWYTFIHHPYDEDENSEQSSSIKGKHSSQKFAAHIPSATEGKTFGMFSESTSLIPRQRFLLLSLQNKQIWLYAYNLTNDAFSTLSKHMIKLVQWNNCRTHLLSNVVTQKCGLFNHYLYGSVLCNMEKLIQQTDSVDQLINHPAPPPPNKEKLTRTQSTSSVREIYLPFDVTFKDLYPNKPLHVSYLACHPDFVKQYGQQAQDIRLDHKRQLDKINNISRLYVMWVQKMTPNFPISESIMKQLKQASRLFHYCATPLLFSAKWRKRVLEKYKVTQQDSQNATVSTNTPDTKTRSRHGSGASTGSVRTKRTDSNELKKQSSLQTFKEYQSDSEDTGGEDEWHLELRSTFIYQYIKYLQTIGFHYVQLDKSQDKGKVKKRSGMPSEDTTTQEIEIKATETHNLQKTVSGGVLLIEISFRNEYFCVKLFTCDHNKLGITVNQQLKLLFVDECEKCKHVIHVHSFAHDFHLRCIQSYINGQHDIFKPGYYVSGLLNDFVKVYAYAPSFSRNFLQREVVCIPKPSCSSKDLYEYMLEHAKLHQMSMLKMTLPPEVDNALDASSKNHEFALISHEVREVTATDANSTSPKKMETYNIGLVILQDCPTLGSVGGQVVGGTADHPLKLQFYMILTSSETLFPRQTLDRERGVLLSRSQSTGEKGISGDLKDQIKVKKSASVREQSTNYLGFSNKHQPPMYKLLQKEAVIVRDKIEKLAVASMDKCRRDKLWTRMLFSKADEQSAKKKSDADSSRDLEKLTFEEFQEMLDRVHKVPLYEMDPRLVPFVHMSTAWYQGLAHVLNNRYTDHFKRCFVNPENNAEQHHIIINPKFLDVFMMLSVDSASGKTGLYAVFRKPAKEQESICPGGQNLPEQSVHSHMEHFINTCCFHMWSSML
ncbi:KICSTOR complex protein SZT2-like isoform X2 [Mercenaria mercenaria]|uniref:KICSTOR complex protein SZT2-like isoform X2 n=1 Tax=Mercenaria mercenaria TaxID=6596 RepID=UPI00234E7727|nr:KICSTOR complex protein SZT2-like isoform X2 [Mercenaria mercenaria]